MPRPFIYDRRNGYFADQDYRPDHTYAMMRYAGQPTTADLIQSQFDAAHKREHRYYGTNPRVDRSRQKVSHRAGA